MNKILVQSSNVCSCVLKTETDLSSMATAWTDGLVVDPLLKEVPGGLSIELKDGTHDLQLCINALPRSTQWKVMVSQAWRVISINMMSSVTEVLAGLIDTW